jgi:uncharacterized cupredoxin-like copper-binding protein
MKLTRAAIALWLTFAAGVMVVACGGEDAADGGGGGGSGITIADRAATQRAQPRADPDPEPDPVAVLTPEPVPGGATEIDVTLKEWEVLLSSASGRAGTFYFRVTNVGPEDPHEFVVIRSDLPPDALPAVDGRVPEDEVDLLDEIEPFAVGSTGSLVLDLQPGRYVFICNIAEIEGGELESHYELGMRTVFVVE